MGEVYKIREKRSPIGVLLRTRDRCDLAVRTLPPLLSEANIDVYWVDGSKTEEGQARAHDGYRDLPGLCEVHTGVQSGCMASWVYGVRRLLQQDYEYLGFVEDDILLEAGWLEVMLALYDKGKRDGLHVGSVSARCIADRIMVPRNGYAVMGNIGAGMSMIKKDVFLSLVYDESKCVLDNLVFPFSEIYASFKELAGVEYPINNRILKDLDGCEIQAGQRHEWIASNDWWWEVVLLRQGMVALAPTPSMARNIDEGGKADIVMAHPTVSDPHFDWATFVARLQKLYENPIFRPAVRYRGMLQTGT